MRVALAKALPASPIHHALARDPDAGVRAVAMKKVDAPDERADTE